MPHDKVAPTIDNTAGDRSARRSKLSTILSLAAAAAALLASTIAPANSWCRQPIENARETAFKVISGEVLLGQPGPLLLLPADSLHGQAVSLQHGSHGSHGSHSSHSSHASGL